MPRAITLSNNIPITNLSDNKNGKKYFKITVPSGSTQLKIQTSGGSGDVDLYVKYGSLPGLNNGEWDYCPYLYGNNESVIINNPKSGDWYIMLHGYNSYSNVTLLATYSTTSQPTYGTMSVIPTSWSTSVNSGSSTSKEFTISASNGNVLGVTISKIEGQNWIQISTTNLGDISSGLSRSFTLTVSPPNGIASGNYSYKIRVSCSSGSPSSIDIIGTITVTTQTTSCIDNYEPNDTLATAYTISTSPIKGKICSPLDEDYFKINVNSPGTITFNLTVPSNKDYELYLYDSYGNKISESINGAGKDESITYSTTSGGTYYILVFWLQRFI